jgi:hypothetical protein
MDHQEKPPIDEAPNLDPEQISTPSELEVTIGRTRGALLESFRALPAYRDAAINRMLNTTKDDNAIYFKHGEKNYAVETDRLGCEVMVDVLSTGSNREEVQESYAIVQWDRDHDRTKDSTLCYKKFVDRYMDHTAPPVVSLEAGDRFHLDSDAEKKLKAENVATLAQFQLLIADLKPA